MIAMLRSRSWSEAKQRHAIVIVPIGTPQSGAYRELGRGPIELEQIQPEAAQRGEVVRGVVLAHAAGIFAKGHVQTPMQRIFDVPMPAHALGELLDGHVRCRCDEVAPLHARFAFAGIARGLYHADLPTVRPGREAHALEHVVHEPVAARLDAPVLLLKRLGVALGHQMADAVALGSAEEAGERVEQRPLVALDGKQVFAAAFAHGARDLALRKAGPARGSSTSLNHCTKLFVDMRGAPFVESPS